MKAGYVYPEAEESREAYLTLLVADATHGPGWCRDNPTEYVDWNTRAEAPDPLQAEIMCDGCPVLLECRAYGNVADRLHGVWGGQVWFHGERLGVEYEYEMEGEQDGN